MAAWPRASTVFPRRSSEWAFMRAWWHADHLPAIGFIALMRPVPDQQGLQLRQGGQAPIIIRRLDRVRKRIADPLRRLLPADITLIVGLGPHDI